MPKADFSDDCTGIIKRSVKNYEHYTIFFVLVHFIHYMNPLKMLTGKFIFGDHIQLTIHNLRKNNLK